MSTERPSWDEYFMAIAEQVSPEVAGCTYEAWVRAG